MTTHKTSYLLQHTHKEPSKLSSTSLLRNMFRDELAERLSEHQLKTCKSYEVVGRNQLESLKHKARKRTKVAMRLETLFEQPKIERTALPGLLSKKQVLGQLPKIIREKSQGWPNQVPFSLFKTSSGRTLFKDGIKLQGSIDFRVSRVKERFEEYKKQWQKHFKQNQNVNSIDWTETKRGSPCNRFEIDPKEEDDNQIIRKSNYWPATLRSHKKETQLEYNQNKTKTLQGELMSSRGRAKLLLQTSWIDNKEEEGYKFKPFLECNQPEANATAPR